MRWSYIISRLTILAVIWAALFFGMDPLVKWGARKTGESVFGAKVEIAKLKTRLFPPSMTVSGVSVADKSDPWKNLFEFSTLKVEIEGRPLFDKSFIVRQGEVSGLRFGTKRSSSGALPARPPSALGKKFAALAGKGKDFALDRVGDIKGDAVNRLKVSPDSLESVRLSNELKASYEKNARDWKARLDGLKIQDRLKKLQESYKDVEREGNTMARIEKAKNLLKDADSLRKDIDKNRAEFQTELDAASKLLAGLDAARKRDADNLAGMMKLPDLDVKAISMYLAGPGLSGRLEKYMGYYETSRKYMPSGSKNSQIETPARKGTVVMFPKDRVYPSFAIRELKVGGVITSSDGKEFNFSGMVGGITNQPPVYGKPMVADIKAQWGQRTAVVNAVLDRTGPVAKDSFHFLFKGFPLQDMKLGDEKSLMVTSTGGTGGAEINVGFDGDNINGKAEISAKDINLKAAVPGGGALDALRGSLEKSLNSARLVTLAVTAGGTMQEPSLSVESNLGQIISGGVKAALGAQVEEYRKALQAKVDEATAGAKKQAQDFLQQQQKDITGQLDAGSKGAGGVSADLQKKVQQAAGGVLNGVKIPQIKF